MISQRTLSAAVVVIGAALAFASPAARADGSSWIAELDAGCNGGNSQDCANLGSQLMGGYVVPADPVRARAAFEKACRLGGMNACVGLYEALSLGQGGPADPERARALESKVCKTGIISSDVYLESKGLCK